MPLAARSCLALAVAWAGGLSSVVGGGPLRLAAALLALTVWAALAAKGGDDSATSHDAPTSRRWAARVCVAVLVALLARALGRVLIEVPAALWSLPLVFAALLLGASTRPRAWASASLAALALAAALLGLRFEAGGPQPHGAALSGPVIGVHPRQAVAVTIDGFGPHDIVVDDYVDPPGGMGYDPVGWAAYLERELWTIAARCYADGPARAREAFGAAKVEIADSIVPPTELGAYESLIGVALYSGTIGEGSRVEFVCPGQVRAPGQTLLTTAGECPRKYLIDGSTGLGVAARFPGYTELRGRDRARLATLLNHPSGDPRMDRRALAVESGLWLLAFVALVLLAGRRSPPSGRAATVALVVASIGALLLGLAALAETTEIEARAIGPTLLAIGLLVLGPGDRKLGLAGGALLALLAASPLAGHGDVLALLDAMVEALAIDLGLSWASARALAAAASVLVLGAGLAVCAASLGSDREQATRRDRWATIALVLGAGLILAMRKPADDLPLLLAAMAPLVTATSLSSLAWRRGHALTLAITLAIAVTLPLLLLRWIGSPVGAVAWAATSLSALTCLLLGLRSTQSNR